MKYLKSKAFWEAALLRAVWTFAESFLALEGTARIVEDVDWSYTISAAIFATFLSLSKSIVVGIPEVKGEQDDK